MKRILLLAGEESGVMYAERIAAAVRRNHPEVEIRGYGDYGFGVADLAVFGFLAVIRRIGFFLRVKRTMERAIDEWRPEVVCTVDYPGMNLKLAAYAKARGARAVHVVCPQVWAWHRGRIPKIEAALDRLCCFFPFEPALFRSGFAEFVGHPLVGEFAGQGGIRAEGGRRTVALLPGSRLGEIDRHMPVLIGAAKCLAERFGDIAFEIPAANRRAKEAIIRWLGGDRSIPVTDGGARELLLRADCAVVASGTATLEAALARCPTVLVYRVGALLAAIARRVIRGVRHVGLANVIAEKAGVECPMPELLQEEFTVEAVVGRLSEWLSDRAAREAAVARLDRTMRLLSGEGDPIGRIAAALETVDA